MRSPDDLPSEGRRRKAHTSDDILQPVLQFMTTEHFVLQTARSATIQEANQQPW
jgi:hypothetical protein